MLNPKELIESIEGCSNNDRGSQKKIYTSFYGFAMSVCSKYANNKDDATEIINDGFLKIFTNLYHSQEPAHELSGSFTAWAKRIFINTAIDHYRRNKKHEVVEELNYCHDEVSLRGEDVMEKLSTDEIMKAVQTLPPGYRIVFNLYAIEGMTHKQISEELHIAEGTSKSNLAKARVLLQKKLLIQSL